MEKFEKKNCFYKNNNDDQNHLKIRFVISEKKYLIPDLYYDFEGKEFFVKSSRKELRKFIEKFDSEYTKIFDEKNIAKIIEKILLRHLIGNISLARKAKKVIIGFNEIKLQLNKKNIYLIFQARNSSQNFEKKISKPHNQKNKINCFTKEELGIAFGKEKIAQIGFLKSSFINPLISDAYRLQSLRS